MNCWALYWNVKGWQCKSTEEFNSSELAIELWASKPRRRQSSHAEASESHFIASDGAGGCVFRRVRLILILVFVGTATANRDDDIRSACGISQDPWQLYWACCSWQYKFIHTTSASNRNGFFLSWFGYISNPLTFWIAMFEFPVNCQQPVRCI